jgi:hypothetical protein
MEWGARLDAWLSENLDTLDHCYEDARTDSQVHFNVFIGPNGNEVWISESSTQDCRVTSCIKDALRNANLPPRPETVPASKSVGISDILSFRRYGTRRLSRGAYAIEHLSAVGPCVDQAHSQLPDDSSDLDAVDARLERAQADFRTCYDEGLSRNSELMGTVTTQFLLAPDGTVSDVGVIQNTLPDCDVVSCISDVLSHLEFDERIAPIMLKRSFPYNPWQ